MPAGKVRQACDCCRTRKIRCTGAHPCINCTDAGLYCTYLAVHKKTGPKGPRRSGPKPSISTSGNAVVTDQLSEAGNSPQSVSNGYVPDPASFQGSLLLRVDFATVCLDAFFKYKYPINPILNRTEIEAALLNLGSEPEIYGMIAACCAVMVQSPRLLAPSSTTTPLQSRLPSAPYGLTQDIPSAAFLIGESIRVRQTCNYIEAPTLTTVQTSFFLFSAFFCLGQDNSAWFYLREAISFLQILHLHEEETYSLSFDSDPSLYNFSRRMFWVLFITERAYAIQRHRLPILEKTIALPQEEADPEKEILLGFFSLISLFEPFDNDFFALWNHSVVLTALPANILLRLQRMLVYTLPSTSGCTKSQLADLLISREWLKIMVWQLCVSNAMLSSSSDEESMSFRYPISIAREVILASHLLPLEAFEANGVGILEKVFDIGCSLADVLSLKPSFSRPSTLEFGPRHYLIELIHIVGTTLGGSSKHLQILVGKATESLNMAIDLPLVHMDNTARTHSQICEDRDSSWAAVPERAS